MFVCVLMVIHRYTAREGVVAKPLTPEMEPGQAWAGLNPTKVPFGRFGIREQNVASYLPGLLTQGTGVLEAMISWVQLYLISFYTN